MIHQTVLPFKLETTNENLTSRGGLALLAEFNHGIGLRELTDKHLPKPGSNRGFAASVFVDTLTLMLQGGGKYLEDIRELENEKGLMKLIKMDKLPNPDSIGDWFRRMGTPESNQSGLLGLDKVREIITKRLLQKDKTEKYTLDVDATEIIGDKEEALYTYKGNKGYMPMLGFLYEPGLCIFDEFREGNESPAKGHKKFYEDCKTRMPKGKEIGYYRADSASYQSELINKLEIDEVTYAITVSQDKAVKAVINTISESEWKEPYKGCGYKVAETVHSTNKTDQAFRLVVKRENRKQPDLFEEVREHYFYHAIATNWKEEDKSTSEVLKWHNQRGQAENFNKELKIGFGMERMPCGQTYANAVFFRIGIISYNLFMGFKRLACPDSWIKHTIATFRWRMIQVAGRIVKHAGNIILKLSICSQKLRLFELIRKQIFELKLSPYI